MGVDNPSDDIIRTLLINAQTIAVVGASSDPMRPSHGIFKMLLAQGYRAIPVNPNESEVLGQKAYPDLASIPFEIDIVDVFRRAEYTPQVAIDAVSAKAKVLWLQSGIISEEASRIARAGGMNVVMDACIAVKHSLLQIPKKT